MRTCVGVPNHHLFLRGVAQRRHELKGVQRLSLAGQEQVVCNQTWRDLVADPSAQELQTRLEELPDEAAGFALPDSVD